MKVTGTALLLICSPLWVPAQGASPVPVPQDAGTVITPPAIREGAPHATVKASCPLAGSFYDGHVTFIAKSSALTLYVSTNEFIPQTRESIVLDGYQRTVAYHPSYGDDQGRRLLWFSLNNLSVGQAYQLDLGFVPAVPPKFNRLTAWHYSKAIYKRRNEIERLFRRLNDFRRIFSRFEKLDVTFTGSIHFALTADTLR